MFGIGDWEVFVIAVVALLLFGNKLPSMMRSLGSSLSEFKRSMNDVRENVRKSIEEAGQPAEPKEVEPEQAKPGEAEPETTPTEAP